MSVTGGDNIKKNVETAKKKLLGGVMRGLTEAQIVVRRDAVRRAPLRFSNLRNSATSPPPQLVNGTPRAVVGFTASYAGYVHEMPEHFNFRTPGTGPKFLQRALVGNADDVLRLLHEFSKL